MRLAAVFLTASLLLAFAGCGGGDDESNVLEVQGDEYAFVMPDEGQAGVVTFDISNTGEELHEYALGKLDEGRTLADVQDFLESGQEEPPDWFTDVGGVPLLTQGEELSLTRELDEGTYVFLCFIESPNGEPHVSLGMLKAFELTGDSGRELPEPDAVVSATPGAYEIPSIEAGRRTLELRNADDTEREFFLVALEPGIDLDDLDRFFEEGEQGEPPAVFHGAMQTIPPGTSVFVDIDLEEGVEYTLVDTSGDEPIVATFTPS